MRWRCRSHFSNAFNIVILRASLNVSPPLPLKLSTFELPPSGVKSFFSNPRNFTAGTSTFRYLDARKSFESIEIGTMWVPLDSEISSFKSQGSRAHREFENRLYSYSQVLKRCGGERGRRLHPSPVHHSFSGTGITATELPFARFRHVETARPLVNQIDMLACLLSIVTLAGTPET